MATTMARPRQPSSGYRNKYYDPVKAHKYYLGKRKLKGYKDRYKNSDRRRKRGDEDSEDTQNTKRRQQESEKARLEEEREQEQLTEEVEQQEDSDETSRKVYAHTGDERTGIHAARGWTVMHAQEQGQAARGLERTANAQLRRNKEQEQSKLIPDGYEVSEEVQAFIERYNDLSKRIRAVLSNLDDPIKQQVTMQLNELDDRMKNLVAGAATLATDTVESSSMSALRERLDRYNRALGR